MPAGAGAGARGRVRARERVDRGRLAASTGGWYHGPVATLLLTIADARAELERETPVCPDVTWRKARLGEAKDEAIANYCACRATQRLPDPACAAGEPSPPA